MGTFLENTSLKHYTYYLYTWKAMYHFMLYCIEYTQ